MATSPLSYFRGGAAILRHHNSNCFPLISQLRFQFVEPGFLNLYLYKIYLRENLIYSRINPICEELFRSNAIFFVSIDDPRRNIDRSRMTTRRWIENDIDARRGIWESETYFILESISSERAEIDAFTTRRIERRSPRLFPRNSN